MDKKKAKPAPTMQFKELIAWVRKLIQAEIEFRINNGRPAIPLFNELDPHPTVLWDEFIADAEKRPLSVKFDYDEMVKEIIKEIEIRRTMELPPKRKLELPPAKEKSSQMILTTDFIKMRDKNDYVITHCKHATKTMLKTAQDLNKLLGDDITRRRVVDVSCGTCRKNPFDADVPRGTTEDIQVISTGAQWVPLYSAEGEKIAKEIGI